ncbi:MAG: nucleotide-binding protein [Elusimicrobiota bacterium]
MNLPLTLLAAALAFSPAASAADLTGTVVETMDAGGYTYMLIKTASGDKKWAAVTKANVKKGQKATVTNSMDMKNFESPSLKRKFDVIAFGAMGGMPAGMSHGSSAPAKDFGPIKVAKAAGPDARTVAEVYAQKKELKGKEVVVSGKVVKYNAGILDRNWAHLRDGSDKSGNNDLTVVMKDETALGAVITVRGKVFLDKDLGGMYKFPVSLDEAVLVK